MQKGEVSFVEETPLKLIGQFLNKQKAEGGETSLDMDLKMDELCRDNRSNNRTFPLNCGSFKNQNNRFDDYSSYPTSKELRVSLQGYQDSAGINMVDIGPDEQKSSRKNNESSSDEDENLNHIGVNSRRSMNVANNFENCGGDEGQVFRCTSVQRRVRNLGRLKTRSRLMDPPEIHDIRSSVIKSGQIRFGNLGRASGMITTAGDDDDPLFDEDLPVEHNKAKFDALTIAQWISLILIVMALDALL